MNEFKSGIEYAQYLNSIIIEAHTLIIKLRYSKEWHSADPILQKGIEELFEVLQK
jgi:hypothetical protein